MNAQRLLFIFFWLVAGFNVTYAEGKYAVLIGIGNYPDSSRLPRLTADKDTARLADALRGRGWTVLLLNNTSPGPSTRLPSRGNIMRALGISQNSAGVISYGGSSEATWFGPGNLTRNDTLIFYYGGHGITDQQSGTDYIIPFDATPNDGQFPLTGLISLPIVETAIAKTGAGKYIMLTDACRNGVVVRDGTLNTPTWRGAGVGDSGRVFQQGDPGVRYFIFRSTDPTHSSYEWPEQESGVYSYFLQKLLTDRTAMLEADDPPKDNCVSLFELQKYVTTRTFNLVQDKYGQTQVPTVSRDGSDWDKSFCMANYQAPQEPSVTPNPPNPNPPNPNPPIPTPANPQYRVGIYVPPYRNDQPPSQWQFFEIDGKPSGLPLIFYGPNNGPQQLITFEASVGLHTFRANVAIFDLRFPFPIQGQCSGTFNVQGPITFIPWWGGPPSAICTLTVLP